MNKPLSKKTASILGAALLISGATIIFITVGQLDDAARASLIVFGAGCIWIGTWVSTVAKSMRDPDVDTQPGGKTGGVNSPDDASVP